MKTTNPSSSKLPLAAVITGLVLFATQTHAAPVTVNNPNFDTGGYPVVPGWGTDANSGVNNALPFGNALWINGSAVRSQTTAEVIAVGITYTLTVDIGQQNLWAGGGAVIRLYGSDNGPGVALAEFDSGNLPTSGNTLLNQTASFTATAGQATGQFVGIALIGGGGTQVRLDNVRLDASAGDTLAPAVTTLSPADNATTVAAGTDLVVTFSEPIAVGTTGNIILKNLTDATQTTIAITSGPPQVSVAGSVLTINPAADLTAGNYAIRIDAGAIKDLAGNSFAGIADDTTWNFTPDLAPPTISSLSPANGAVNVPTGVELVAAFSENVQKGSGNIVIRKSSDNSVFESINVTSGNVAVIGASVTINPAGNLAESTGYYVEIDSGAIKDLVNNPFAGVNGNSTWSFTNWNGLGSITVLNPSFENGIWGTDTATHDDQNPVRWSTNPITDFRPRASIGSLTPTDGIRQAWMNNGTFAYQDTGVVIVEGRTYTMKVDLGADQGNFPNIETVAIRLYGSDAGFGTALAEITPNGPGTTQWLTNQTVSFTATAGQATGQTLGIYLAVTGGTQAEWDNVRLEAGIGGGGTPFADWAAGYTPPMSAGVDDGFGDDYDLDGTPNGHEFYFFDSDPTVAGAHGSPISGAARTAADKFEFTHNRRLDRTDVTETYQWSPDLDNWYDADGLASDGTHTVSVADKAVVAGPTANLETVTVEATVGGGTMSKLFLRLNLSSP